MRRDLCLASVSLSAAALLAASLIAAPADATVHYGPSVPFTRVLDGQHRVIPLVDAAKISRTRHGYLYRAGQQNSHLAITRVAGGLRFRDSGTRKWKSLPTGCHRVGVSVGVAAVCGVPARYGARNHMLVEVWPRLGNDYIDASSLSATFDVTALVDAGHDVVRLGAGNDFVNGAFDGDTVSGGAGNDWIRTGTGGDAVWGGEGHDKVVGGSSSDVLHGGPGNDVVYGGAGADALWMATSGQDLASCGGGSDHTQVNRWDRTRGCESVSRK